MIASRSSPKSGSSVPVKLRALASRKMSSTGRPLPTSWRRTATGRSFCSTMNSTPSWTLARMVWRSRASSDSLMRMVATGLIVARTGWLAAKPMNDGRAKNGVASRMGGSSVHLYAKSSLRRRPLKGREWGETLAAYVRGHPWRAAILRRVETIMRASTVSYDLHKQRLFIDPY